MPSTTPRAGRPERVNPAHASTRSRGAHRRPPTRRAWLPAAAVAALAALAVLAVAQPWPTAPTRAAARPTPGSPRLDRPAPSTPAPTPAARRTPSVHPTPTPPAAPAAPKTIRIDTPVVLHTPGSAPRIPWPSAGQAAISIAGTGSVGDSRGGVVSPTASVAKIMTAYVVLTDHPLDATGNGPTIHVLPAEAAILGRQISQQQSVVPVTAGEAITERDALEALLLASANNMAQILARWDGGTVTNFVAKMNAAAARLGMAHTHYTDPSGYTATTTSTVADQITLAQAALAVPQLQHITSLRSASIPVKGYIINFNQLLRDPAVIGLKTGSMSASGGCLVYAAQYTIAGTPVKVVGAVFGQQGPSGILHAAFSSSRAILDATRSALKPITIVHAGQTLATVPGSTAKLVAARDLTVVATAGMAVRGTLDATVADNTRNGATAGTFHVAGRTVAVTLARA